MSSDERRPLRVYLREPTPADAEALAEATLRSRELHYPWASPATTPDGWRRQIAQLGERRKSRLGCRHADDAIVGSVNLNDIVHGAFRSAHMGYEAFTPHDGQGYMRETLSLVVDWAFAELRLHRLEANIQPGNTPSAALVQGLGFRNEGFSPRYLFLSGAWRDHDRWAITAEEWPPSEES
jgi:ribosomal-protein-alanine N-acetyltransferase